MAETGFTQDQFCCYSLTFLNICLLTGNHDGLGVAPQTVLQQPRQHRVSVRNKHWLLLIGVDAIWWHVSWRETGSTTIITIGHAGLKQTFWSAAWPSDEMTLPRVTSDLLMFPPSFRRTPVAPVASARSLPARSTRWILLTVSLGISASNLACNRQKPKGDTKASHEGEQHVCSPSKQDGRSSNYQQNISFEKAPAWSWW